MKERNVGIDILKFLAVLLITNSHIGFLYVKFNWLATGGAIGNVLFFFCSGFTLFLKPFKSASDFPNWYKRRINRIYPVVFAISIVRCVFFDDFHVDIISVITDGGRWFVPTIMVLYIFIYFVGLYLRRWLNWVIAAVALITIVWFYCIPNRDFPFAMFSYSTNNIRWPLYFLYMLIGAKMGMMSSVKQNHQQADHQWRNLIYCLLGVAGFYLLTGVTDRVESLSFLHVYSLIPMIAVAYYLYWLCMGQWAKSIYNTKAGNFIVRFVGGLCLEIYIIQICLFTTKLNFLFPLNIPIFFIILIVVAYLCSCLGRLIRQTFQDMPYNWKEIISVY